MIYHSEASSAGEEHLEQRHLGYNARPEALHVLHSQDETLPLEEARCNFLPSRSAAWLSKSTKLPLSTLG